MGGAALVPEDATNMSFGFTSSPISGLNLTFDYYSISIENKIIKSMLNVGIKYPGEIELTGFDFDINVKFKNSLDMEIAKESIISNLNWNNKRPTNIYDTANGFGVYNRSSLKKIGLLVYDKQMQLKSKDIHNEQKTK